EGLLYVIPRVGCVGKGVPQHVKGNGDDGYHDGREDELVSQGWSHHQSTALVDQVAQRRSLQGQAQTDISQEDLAAYGVGNGQGHPHHDDGYQVRQDVLDNDPVGGCAQATGSQVVLPVPDNQDQVADQFGHGQPTGDAHGDDHGGKAGTQDIGHHDHDDGGRNIVPHVIYFRYRPVQPAH